MVGTFPSITNKDHHMNVVSVHYHPIVVLVTSVKTGLLRITKVATAEHDVHLMVVRMTMTIVMTMLMMILTSC